MLSPRNIDARIETAKQTLEFVARKYGGELLAVEVKPYGYEACLKFPDLEADDVGVPLSHRSEEWQGQIDHLEGYLRYVKANERKVPPKYCADCKKPIGPGGTKNHCRPCADAVNTRQRASRQPEAVGSGT